MSKKLIIFGAGGFSKSIIDSLNHKHYELIGFIDKYKSGYHQSYPILGNDIADIENKDNYYYFIGIGKPSTRKHYLNIIRKHNLRLINIIDKLLFYHQILYWVMEFLLVKCVYLTVILEYMMPL